MPSNHARLAFTFAMAALFLCAVPSRAQFTYSDLADFHTCSFGIGCDPLNYGQLTIGLDGNFYGTAQSGGAQDVGSIFMLTPSGSYTDLWDFDNTTGAFPYAGLYLASDGNFYGTAFAGGAYGYGTIFRFTPPSTVTVLHSFSGTDGANAAIPPVQGKDGNLYGVSFDGKPFTIILATGVFKQLPQSAPGTLVSAPLYLASDGNLYGATSHGGANNAGSIFRMTTPGGAIKTIHSFSTADGANPAGPLTQGSDSFFYGTTLFGGANGNGTVFKISGAGKILSSFSFDAYSSGNINNFGSAPFSGLLSASDGYLYGVTESGGATGSGTIYRVSTTLAFTKLFDFTGTAGPTPGAYATTGLMQHPNGDFYSLTQFGGAAASGNFYSLAPFNLTQILIVEGPIFVKPGTPVELLGNNLSQVFQLNFGSVSAQFQPGTNNYLTATVPYAAIDAPITATLVTGLQNSTTMAVHILPVITALDPLSGPPGTVVTITGGGFNRTTKLAFGGVLATSFTVLSPTQIQATVPTGAKTGKVGIATPNGTAISPQKFTVN